MSRIEEFKQFGELIDKYRYDYDKLVYIIWPFGEKGTDLEDAAPYEWQIHEWRLMSAHFKNPLTRDIPYKLALSSGNGSAKTAFGSMTNIMLMYSQRLRARVTANTYSQLKSIVWPELDVWCGRARFFDETFDKLGESIKSRDEKLGETWRTDMFTWDMNNPAAISGLHNKNNAIMLWFEESAGIPSVVWKYANGAMTDVDTIKIWLAMANSDDPESAFEQKMISPDWRGVRIDTRTLKHVSKAFIDEILRECGGDENHDDFRVRVRGLPRKSSADSIISAGRVASALEHEAFDFDSQSALPCVMTADLAWTGGDSCAIFIHQGNYSLLVDYYKLDKDAGQTHIYTYQRMCQWEKKYKVDYVLVDQAEGSAVFSIAQAQGKQTWELVSFASSPNDTPETKDSQYHNMRAQMYYEAEKWLSKGGKLDVLEPEWKDLLAKELCWTKGTRNKLTLKKQAEPKDDIRKRVGKSPDMSDAFVLRFSRTFFDRLPENTSQEMRDVYELDGQKEYDPYAGM